MIVGVDVSSRRVDLAWVENGKPCRWHQELAKGHLIDRLRSIRVLWPNDIFIYPGSGHGVTDIAIEYPFARQKPAVAALMAVVGVVTRQAPPWARVAWPSSGELRSAIDARNTKHDAMVAVYTIHNPTTGTHPLNGWDEHELDALTTCIGWTRILEQQDAE